MCVRPSGLSPSSRRSAPSRRASPPLTRELECIVTTFLRELAPGLRNLGYAVESSRSEENRIRRPVLYGSNGRAEVAYDIDAFHDDHGIVVEVEAGRAASNNATYRDIIRASLILDAQYLVLLLPVTYRFSNRGEPASVPVFMRALDLLSALYASQRLPLPLRGVLLVGY